MIAHFNRDQLALNLPDAYAKGAHSNNAKILAIEKGETDSLRADLQAIAECLDLDKASGKTLDLYGEMLGQYRGAATDEQLRVLIKGRIARSIANSDFNSIVQAVCTTFACGPGDIKLIEHSDPCKLTLEGLPVEKLNESNIDVNTAVQIIFALMPAGVLLESVSFAGTFEFGSTAMEYDEEKGFGNIEQTIGGYLGLASNDASVNLPV